MFFGRVERPLAPAAPVIFLRNFSIFFDFSFFLFRGILRPRKEEEHTFFVLWQYSTTSSSSTQATHAAFFYLPVFSLSLGKYRCFCAVDFASSSYSEIYGLGPWARQKALWLILRSRALGPRRIRIYKTRSPFGLSTIWNHAADWKTLMVHFCTCTNSSSAFQTSAHKRVKHIKYGKIRPSDDLFRQRKA